MQPFASRSVLVVFAVVVLAVTAGCLSGPLGGAPSNMDDADPTTNPPNTNPPTTSAPTSDDHTSGTPTTDGTTTPSSNVDVTYLDDGPALADDLPPATTCAEGGWVSYWGTGDTSMLWEPGNLHVGWTVPANQSTLFVAFENDTAVGAAHEYYGRGSVTADGAAVPVADATGEGQYAVVMMLDVNDNGEYDPGTDRPCASDSDSAIVMTDWLWVDWNTTR